MEIMEDGGLFMAYGQGQDKTMRVIGKMKMKTNDDQVDIKEGLIS